MPDQDSPDQLSRTRTARTRSCPDHDIPDQVMPDHDSPDQVMPDQVSRTRTSRTTFQAARPGARWAPGALRPPSNLPRPTTDVDLTADLTAILTVTWTEPRETPGNRYPWRPRRSASRPPGWRCPWPSPGRADRRPAGRGGVGDRLRRPGEQRLHLVRREVGRCWISSAAAPETTAADCEVPLPRKSRSPMRAAGYVASR